MCASRGLLQKSPALCSSALASSKQRLRKQLARPTSQPSSQAVRGLPALQLRKQPSRPPPGTYGRCYAAAETAAVSQGLGSPTSGANSSSSSGNAASAASVSGSTPQSGPSGTANSNATTGGSSSTSTSASPSPLPGSAGAAAGQSAGGTSTAGPPGGAGAPAPAPFSVKPVYVLIFTLLFLGGLLFASMSLQLTSDMGFRDALTKVVRRIFRSIAFRQLVVITACILLVRFALNNVLRFLARWSSSPVQWDKSKLFYVMKEVYSPLELLLFIAGCCTIADSFVPQLMNVPKATVTQVVRAVLSMSFVVGASVVVFNLKSRFCKEQAWNCEMQGDITSQRRWEAYDKLGTFAIYVIGTILVIQALGLEVRSVLAIGGIGGLAIGLAGREICENLLNGFLLMTTMPFEVGEEVMFRPKANEMIEGIVVDVGWYRTLIRSFEREMYVIPNAVFSKNTVLNVTRKMREWRFYEYLCVRVQDVHKVNAIIQDIRRIVRNDARIMNKLHRRVFLDKIGMEDLKIYISFYVEASNRDAFMAVKQDLLLAFVDCVERNGAKLAQPRTVLELDPTVDTEALLPRMSALGLLPAPGGTGGLGAYGPRGMAGSNIPITVQVVDSVEVTPIDSPTSNGNGSSASSKDGSSKGGSNKGGGGGGTTTKAAGTAEQQQQQVQQAPQQQQQQQQLQPSVAFAAAGAAAAAGGGKVMDAAGMAAGSNAQRKGAGAGEEEGGSSRSTGKTGKAAGSSSTAATPSSKTTGSRVQPDRSAISATESNRSAAGASVGSSSSSSSPAAAAVAAAAAATASSSSYSRSSSSTTASGPSVRSAAPSGSSSSSNGGGNSSGGSSGGSSSVPSSRSGSPYTVVTGAVQGGSPGSPTAASQQRPDSVTILASFEDL